jgi:type IV secretory pathway VirB2 component (pilin)
MKLKVSASMIPVLARLAVLLIFVAHPAFADDGSPFQGPVDWLISILTGTFARSAAVLVIILLGYFCWVGRMSWDWRRHFDFRLGHAGRSANRPGRYLSDGA